ncbi:hypothetical protein OG607_18725 [Streptomyces sp. NBC_01537]|uniref:hypothetical protein n=1 Tax=Streptomyces sp. NBC_01537 TaxID=2903896 RepID=UPI003865C46A
MNSHSNLSSLQALPDGEAELQLVVHLRWEDLAALGREASRLAVRLQRPVGLDEAATQHLRSRLAAPAAPAPEPAPQAAPAAPIAITAGAGLGATGSAEQTARHRVQQVPQVQQPQAAPAGVSASMTTATTATAAITPTVSSLAGRTPPPEPTLPGSAA